MRIFNSLGMALMAWLISASAAAQIYTGGGISAGTTQAGQIVGNTDLRTKIIQIVQTVLSYMALAAVVVIVIAGIRLVVSQGEEDQKEKAKKTIIYAVVGLIIILLAKGLVYITIQAAR